MNWNEPPWVVRERGRDARRSVYAGVAPHEVANPLDDHGTDGREDYAVALRAPLLVLGAGGLLVLAGGEGGEVLRA